MLGRLRDLYLDPKVLPDVVALGASAVPALEALLRGAAAFVALTSNTHELICGRAMTSRDASSPRAAGRLCCSMSNTRAAKASSAAVQSLSRRCASAAAGVP